MKITHTPIPWKVDRRGNVLDAKGESILVSGFSMPNGNHPQAEESDANSELICKAVNCHAELLEACKASLLLYSCPNADLSLSARNVRDQIEAAISKAEAQ